MTTACCAWREAGKVCGLQLVLLLALALIDSTFGLTRVTNTTGLTQGNYTRADQYS